MDKTDTEMAMAKGSSTRLVGHPSLLTWSPPRAHQFSKPELEALTAICDTLIPSLPPPEGQDEDVARFYKAAPSEEGVIDAIAAALGCLARPVNLKTFLAVMRLLGTGWGTFLLGSVGGVSTFTLRYPFLRKFSSLPPADRERVLQGWSGSSIAAIRQMFKALKGVTSWAFYSKLDERGENVAWRAIRYVGAAPEVRRRTQEDFDAERPLGVGHIDAKAAGAELKPWLASKGFSVVEDIEGLEEERRDGDVYLECDAVIVGSGCGGGVMAAALAAQGFKVVVLEKGEYFAAQDFTSLEGPAMVHLLEKMGCLATDDGGVALLAGKTVGGGTAVNWSVSFKTPENVRSEWAKDHGLDLFQSARYDAALQAVWERLGVQPDVARHNLQNAVLQEGCQKLNLQCGTLARNAPPDHFCGWCSYGCPSGKKQSTAQTWLVDAVNTGNAVILSNCTADRVLHSPSPDSKKPRRAHGIAATIDPHHRIFIKANATVVSCGALMTPVLLLRSGFSNPNIGKFLRLHPASTTWGYFPEGVGPEGKAYEGGIMTAYSPVTLRKPTEYGALLETGVFHPAVFTAFHAWRSGADAKAWLLRHARTSHITIVTRDKGSGTVKVDREGYPVFEYSISPYDEETLMGGIVQSLRVLIAAGAVEVGTQHLDGERFDAKGASEADTEAYLGRVKRRGARESVMQVASAHQLGSCRMGTSPSTAAVDPKGELWEAQGLFVSDGSVLPTSSGVNPMVTIQSIAFCTADSVAQYLRMLRV